MQPLPTFVRLLFVTVLSPTQPPKPTATTNPKKPTHENPQNPPAQLTDDHLDHR